MIKVAISGACGRMGRRLIDLVHADDELELTAAVDAAGHPDAGKDAGELAGIGSIGIPVTSEVPDSANVLIEFSAPEPTVEHALFCAEHGIAAVLGTTGLSPEQKRAVESAARKTAVLPAPNMSVGVNVAFEAAALLAKALGDDYDVEIVEMHHRLKKDAPSGTARGFAERVANALHRDLSKDAVYGREGLVGERPQGQIGIHAVRGGDVVGEHRVIFSALGERIELVHIAQNRDVFVRGAIRAAKAIAGKPPGLYTVNELVMG